MNTSSDLLLLRACKERNILAAQQAILNNVNKCNHADSLDFLIASGTTGILALLLYYGVISIKEDDGRFMYNFPRYFVKNAFFESLRIVKNLKYCCDDQSSLFSLLPPELIEEIQMNMLEEENINVAGTTYE